LLICGLVGVLVKIYTCTQTKKTTNKNERTDESDNVLVWEVILDVVSIYSAL
jgi:hypothetical protein